MGQAKQRGTFEERKTQAERKNEAKAQWMAKQQEFTTTGRVRPTGGRMSRNAIIGAALATSMGVTYNPKE